MSCCSKEFDIILLIKHLNKLLKNDFDRRLEEYDLTGQQGRILFFLNRKAYCENEIVHQNDIEKEFGLSKSTVSGLVKRLEKKGLIEKKSEGLFNSWVPTENGKNIVNYFHKHKIDTIEKLVSGLNSDEVEKLKENIKLLIDNMEKEERYVEEN